MGTETVHILCKKGEKITTTLGLLRTSTSKFIHNVLDFKKEQVMRMVDSSEVSKSFTKEQKNFIDANYDYSIEYIIDLGDYKKNIIEIYLQYLYFTELKISIHRPSIYILEYLEFLTFVNYICDEKCIEQTKNILNSNVVFNLKTITNMIQDLYKDKCHSYYFYNEFSLYIATFKYIFNFIIEHQDYNARLELAEINSTEIDFDEEEYNINTKQEYIFLFINTLFRNINSKLKTGYVYSNIKNSEDALLLYRITEYDIIRLFHYYELCKDFEQNNNNECCKFIDTIVETYSFTSSKMKTQNYLNIDVFINSSHGLDSDIYNDFIIKIYNTNKDNTILRSVTHILKLEMDNLSNKNLHINKSRISELLKLSTSQYPNTN